jgi:peroxiredoxin
MKKILMLAGIVMPGFLVAQTSSNKIIVQLPKVAKNAHAYLTTSFGWDNQQVIDSAVCNNGVFVLKANATNITKAEIVVNHIGAGIPIAEKLADVMVVYLNGTTFTVKGSDSIKMATVTGSPLNTAYKQYHQIVLADAEKTSHALDAAYVQASDQQKKDPRFVDSLMSTIKRTWAKRDSLKYAFIKKYPQSYFSLEALIELSGKDIDVQKTAPLFEKLSGPLRNSKEGLAFAKRLYDKGPTSVGALAPDFEQPDAQGNKVKLSDFKGRYVLLDFWASWCGPCRAENPEVVKAFNAYKDRSFTVLGVSLDKEDKRDAWQQAIVKDGLVWTQVADLKGWDNSAAKLYEVNAIPQNYLIDPTGKIVAKNLRGEALHAKLKELLGE